MIHSPFFSPSAPVHPPIHPPLSPLDNFLALHPTFSYLDFPPSPSDTCSSVSTDFSPSPPTNPIRVVCDVPLLAPRPLPYHSPTFLQFDLPDTDEDLSHPPYTHRPSKRKHDSIDDPALPEPQSKRRSRTHTRRSRPVNRSWDTSLPAQPSHRSSNRRSRT